MVSPGGGAVIAAAHTLYIPRGWIPPRRIHPLVTNRDNSTRSPRDRVVGGPSRGPGNHPVAACMICCAGWCAGGRPGCAGPGGSTTRTRRGAIEDLTARPLEEGHHQDVPAQ